MSDTVIVGCPDQSLQQKNLFYISEKKIFPLSHFTFVKSRRTKPILFSMLRLQNLSRSSLKIVLLFFVGFEIIVAL